MSSSITEYVMAHPLFDHHDHTESFRQFDETRKALNEASLEGYALADLRSAAGRGPAPGETLEALPEGAHREKLWAGIRNTGYGRATEYTCRELFGLPYDPENWGEIAEKVQALAAEKTNPELYEYCFREKANIKWVMQDGLFRIETSPDAEWEGLYPEFFRYAFRFDELFYIRDREPIQRFERVLNCSIHTLDQLVDALNVAISRYQETGRMSVFKNGMAYNRTLKIDKASRYDAEKVFSRIVGGEGIALDSPIVSDDLSLGDYLVHAYIQRADDEDIPVQIHTGYLAGNWKPLAHTSVVHLVPVFRQYPRSRFDIFHASWPYTSELGCIAKEFPNVYPDLCWMWAMNPAHAERALYEWLDGVPYNKIFGFGADTGLPFNVIGYAQQARMGISRVLERKVNEGLFSDQLAQEIASAIMLKNGEEFYKLAT